MGVNVPRGPSRRVRAGSSLALAGLTVAALLAACLLVWPHGAPKSQVSSPEAPEPQVPASQAPTAPAPSAIPEPQVAAPPAAEPQVPASQAPTAPAPSAIPEPQVTAPPAAEPQVTASQASTAAAASLTPEPQVAAPPAPDPQVPASQAPTAPAPSAIPEPQVAAPPAAEPQVPASQAPTAPAPSAIPEPQVTAPPAAEPQVTASQAPTAPAPSAIPEPQVAAPSAPEPQAPRSPPPSPPGRNVTSTVPFLLQGSLVMTTEWGGSSLYYIQSSTLGTLYRLLTGVPKDSLGTPYNLGTILSMVYKAFWDPKGFAYQMSACSHNSVQYDLAKFKIVRVNFPCDADFIVSCTADTIANEAQAEARNQGVSITGDTRRLHVVAPAMGDGRCQLNTVQWAGLANVAGVNTWYLADGQGIFSAGTVMQEVIHSHEYWDSSTSVLSPDNFPVDKYKRYSLPYTYAGPEAAFLKILPSWDASYTKNVYLALRGAGKGDWNIRSEFIDRISVHEGDVPSDNTFTTDVDRHYTLITTIAQNSFYDMRWHHLAIRTGALANSMMEVQVCRYSGSPDNCAVADGGTICNPVPGYTAYPDVDHALDDIVRMPTFNETLVACNLDVNCKGFNSLGWLKTVVSVTNPLAGNCLYAKYLEDISLVTPMGTAYTKCLENIACRGFNNFGWLKRRTVPSIPQPGFCLYSKISMPCQNINGYALQTGVDHYGDDIGQKTTLSEVISACNLDPTCKGCKPYTGYTAIANRNHEGDTLASLSNSDTAFSACNLDVRCLGFSSGGLIKSVATPLVSQEGSCFYTKTLPSLFNDLGYFKNRLYPTEPSALCLCPPISGYSSQANADHIGDDIGRKGSTEEAATACSLDSNCRGFNSLGYFKWAMTPVVSSDTCLYTKQTCQNIAGYTVQANLDHWADDIGKAASGAEAAIACNADDTCRGCIFVPGYTAKAATDHWLDDIGKAANMWDAASACNADVNCKGFNSDGWYKYIVVPNMASSFCLYTKITFRR
ncbi:hypothetical protein HYH03_018833 [Edaphochlamys debaryana]|uniref:Peptidase M11 gametolysin domain-containing protein n=1 Tax=Edaphochlamys debaryana TaxID=47281 RepID=A0A835XF49_9CHLO|nr:hypothetical protein HYH03_018833 [Edaphochlamys debaryana]|eukprot:KAG2482219.1 hypothetical protein HYH03_018833 [Edaphochlamys debaryana]